MLKICRLCGDYQPVHFSIFGSDGKTRNLHYKIKMYLGIDVDLDDRLPQVVCNVCCERLEFYSKFCAKCHETQEKFNKSYFPDKRPTNRNHLFGHPFAGKLMKIKERVPSSLSFAGLIDKIASVKTSSSSPWPMTISATSSEPSVESSRTSSTSNDAVFSIDTVINVDCENDTANKVISKGAKSKLVPEFGFPIPTYLSIKDNELVSFVPVKIKGTGDQLSCQIAIPRYNSQIKVMRKPDTTDITNKSPSHIVDKKPVTIDKNIPDANTNKAPFRRIIRLPASKSVTDQVEKISNTVHRCKLCGACFKQNFQCEYHVRSHIGEETFVCNICSKRFVALYMLKRHQRSHEEGFPYICKTCNRGFRTSFSLKTHEKTHLDEPAPFKCDICQREFYFRTSFVDHVSIHDSERQRFACDTCKKTYTSKRHLKEHVERVHNKVTRHFCPICNKGFYRNSTLKLHERLHTTERPHCCEVCGHSFNEKINLERHRKVHTKKNIVLNQETCA